MDGKLLEGRKACCVCGENEGHVEYSSVTCGLEYWSWYWLADCCKKQLVEQTPWKEGKKQQLGEHSLVHRSVANHAHTHALNDCLPLPLSVPLFRQSKWTERTCLRTIIIRRF